jgi:hypothetical protein
MPVASALGGGLSLFGRASSGLSCTSIARFIVSGGGGSFGFGGGATWGFGGGGIGCTIVIWSTLRSATIGLGLGKK